MLARTIHQVIGALLVILVVLVEMRGVKEK